MVGLAVNSFRTIWLRVMYQDTQSIKQFERRHALDRLIEEAHHIGDVDEARSLGAHLAAEREGQRVMVTVAIAVVGLLVVTACWAM